MYLLDASVSADGKTLTISKVGGTSVNFTSGGSYNDGYNQCVDDTADTGVTALTGFSTLAGGRSIELFTDGTNSVGTHVWRYGGTTGTRYKLMSKKT